MVEQTRPENYEEFKGIAFNDMKVGVTVGYFNSRKQIDKIIKEWSKLSSDWHLIVLGNYDKNLLLT